MAVGGMIVAILIGVPAGIVAGLPGTARDRLVTVGSSLGVAIPDFWLAMLLVIVFAVKLQLLPALGYMPFAHVAVVEWFQHLLLPWLALGIGGAATIARQVRGALIDTLDQDYIRTAVAKGLHPRVVVGKHALKNALSPAVTVIGIQFGYLLGGTLIIEQIFSFPGIGTYISRPSATRTFPSIQGVVLVTADGFVVINLVVDILYAYLNPKVRLS